MKGKIKHHIVIFEDSKDALIRFSENLKNSNIKLKMYRQPIIDQSLKDDLISFNPDLIVIDLVLEGSREDGYQLIKDIQEDKKLTDVPIVVCSKFINESPRGLKEKEVCLNMPGVVAAFGKIPNFPSSDELLRFIRKEN